MKKTIVVIKKNIQLEETWRYQGIVVNNLGNEITIEAKFNREDFLLHGILLRQGDTFVETYYSDRWYNIFAMYDRDDGQLKGWYCNISYPAQISANQISYVDLALDLLVKPGGEQLVLDEDEFSNLEIDEQVRSKALQALTDLEQLFSQKFEAHELED